MQCLNCGEKSNKCICKKCQQPDVLDKIYNDVRTFKRETNEYPYLVEYFNSLEEGASRYQYVLDILPDFAEEIAEYYYCRIYKSTNNPEFEDRAIVYLTSHPLIDLHTQYVLYDLLNYYLRDDYYKPKKWCDMILEADNLCCELYMIAAQYYSMIAEYDLSDQTAQKGLSYCQKPNANYAALTAEKVEERLQKQLVDTERYRTKKPYWPATEERRKVIAEIYEEKGIVYQKLSIKSSGVSKKTKISEREFAPIKECLEDDIVDYCAFWCMEAFSLVAAKGIYQIAAVKIRNGKKVDEFQSYVRPWDSQVSRKAAASEAGVPIDVIENADAVGNVTKKFFEFVGDDILVSTGALGQQSKLLSRAARYSKMKEIKNEFFDLLDFAADKSVKFDMKNNTREYLLSFFKIKEGKDALGKARNNVKLFEMLKKYGD